MNHFLLQDIDLSDRDCISLALIVEADQFLVFHIACSHKSLRHLAVNICVGFFLYFVFCMKFHRNVLYATQMEL